MSKGYSVTLVILGLVLTSYFGYVNFKEKNHAKLEITRLNGELDNIQQQQIKTNQIIAKSEQDKVNLENKSNQQQEQINELLKNNQCANELVPSAYADRLYNRANQIRQSADTIQSIK